MVVNRRTGATCLEMAQGSANQPTHSLRIHHYLFIGSVVLPFTFSFEHTWFVRGGKLAAKGREEGLDGRKG